MLNLIRPDAASFLSRWGEVFIAAGLALIALWVFSFGGWFFQAIGLLLAFAAAAGALIAWRRARFRRDIAQPGVIEVDEGQIRYFGPEGGGFAALREVVELTLLQDTEDQSWWQLREAGGGHVKIPTSANGAEALFDAFAALPGIDMGALSAALSKTANPGAQILWQRKDAQGSHPKLPSPKAPHH